MTRLPPLPIETHPELNDVWATYEHTMGFVPNSTLIMQRRPRMVKALAALSAAVWDPESTVDRGFKRLLAHVASRASGCQYCMAHTADGALRLGVGEERLAAIWDYQTSPLFSAAERIALDVAVAAGSVPNGVTDEMFARLRVHWDDGQIVEILGVIALFGFLNRWNDSLATPLEEKPQHVGTQLLASHGWSAGKHASEP